MRRPPFDGAEPASGVILLNCTTSEKSANRHCGDILRRLSATLNDGEPFPVYFFDAQERFHSWMYPAQADNAATQQMVWLSCAGMSAADAPLPLTAYDLRHSDTLPRVRYIFVLTDHGRAGALSECPPKYAFELRDLWLRRLRLGISYERVLAMHIERHQPGKIIDLWWLYAYFVDSAAPDGELLPQSECEYVRKKAEQLHSAFRKTREYRATDLRLTQLETQIAAAVGKQRLQAFINARLEYLSTYDPVAIYHLGKLHRMRNASGAPSSPDDLWWLNYRRAPSKPAAWQLEQAYLASAKDQNPALTMSEFFQAFDTVHGINQRFALVYYLDDRFDGIS